LGCIETASETVTNPNAPTITLVTQSDVTCFGDNDGAILVNVSGGTAPYASFSWSQSGVITQDLTNSGPIYDTLTVTDADGCTATYSDSILEPSILTISGLDTNVFCLGAMDGSIDITVAGGTPFVLASAYTYSWTSTNSGFVPNPTLTEDLVALDTGIYTVVATDSNGCTIAEQYTITQPVTMALSSVVVIDSCFQEGAGEIDITVTQGTAPYVYSWTALLPSFTPTSNEDITNLVAATYNLTIVDDNGCQKDTSFILIESPQIIADVTVTNANCLLSNGSVVSNASGGTAPYTYDWDAISTGADTTNVPSGTYNLGVIDAFGCRLDTVITINDIAAPTITVDNITNVTCFGFHDGSVDVTITGTAPFTYLWNSNAISQLEDLTNAPADVYIYQVTDAAGCISFETITIGSPAEITGNPTVIDATCGICDGEATITALGGMAPYTYNWSDGQTTATADSLCPGVQTVQITDFNNCVVNVNVGVSDIGGATSYTMTEVDVTCNDGSDGSADVTASGGTLPYTYLWIHDGNTNSLASNLEVGTYNVEITDSNGCVLVGETTITTATVIAATAFITPSTCGGSDGAIVTTTTGGTGTYTYMWSPAPGTGQDTTAAAEGIYTLTIDDGNCQVIETFTIPGIGSPEVTLQTVESNCYDDNTGAISATVTNNIGVVTYEWFNGVTSMGAAGAASTVSALAPGTYTVEVFDPGTGCFAYATGVVTAPDTILFSTSTIIDPSCGGNCDGEAYAVVSGGTLPYTYTWTGNPSTGSGATSLCVGADTVTITDANLCTVFSEVIVNELSAVSIVIDSITDAYCVNSTAGAIYITANGGSLPYTYNWASIPPSGFVDPGGPSITNVLPMDYEVTITDAIGCTYIDTIPVDTLNILIANAGIDSSLCVGGCIDLIGTATGAINYTLEWFEVSNGVSTSLALTDTLQYCPIFAELDILVLVATDLNCSSADTVEVLANPLPIVDAGFDYVESYGTSIVIGGSPTADYGPYQWTPTTNFTDTSGTEANPELIVLSSQNYVVTVIDTNGCANSDTVYVELLPDIIFPNGFSPNGDGINDTWQLDLITDFPECVIEVYNRWGQQLFISVGDVQQFDGTHKGQELPVGTYYYIIVLNHPEYPDAFTGPVTIMR
jgi:gliding motility-associated-like protein